MHNNPLSVQWGRRLGDLLPRASEIAEEDTFNREAREEREEEDALQ